MQILDICGMARYARYRPQPDPTGVAQRLDTTDTREAVATHGMSIGGVNTVRGYRENQLIRDNGATVCLEFDYPLFEKSAHGLNLSLIPFYDLGRGQNRNEPALTLSSWGLASRLRWQGFHLDIAVAHRLSHPASIQRSTATLQDRGIHFNLSYNY